jgi:DNA-binding MarR family transcriptional regulator
MNASGSDDRRLELLDVALSRLRRIWGRPNLREVLIAHFGQAVEPGTIRTLRAIEGLVRPDLGMGEVAAALDVEPSTASRLVERLVEEGLVARTPCEADRRRVHLQLTGEGENFLARARAARMATYRQILRDWPARDIDRLSELLERLNENIERIGSTQP